MVDYQFKYTVDEVRRLIIFRVAGAVPSAVLLDGFLTAYQSIANAWQYDRLIDYRRFTGLMDFRDLEALADRNLALNGGRSARYKVAVVSNDPLEQARPATTRHLFAEDIRAFATMNDALDWLSGAHAVGQMAAKGQ